MHVRSVASENLAGVTRYTNISVPANAALAQQHFSAPKADHIHLSCVGTRKVTFNLHTCDGARGAGLASPQPHQCPECPSSPALAGGLPQQKPPLTGNKVARWRLPTGAAARLGKSNTQRRLTSEQEAVKSLTFLGFIRPLSGEPPTTSRNDTVPVSAQLIIAAAIHRVTPGRSHRSVITGG